MKKQDATTAQKLTQAFIDHDRISDREWDAKYDDLMDGTRVLMQTDKGVDETTKTYADTMEIIRYGLEIALGQRTFGQEG